MTSAYSPQHHADVSFATRPLVDTSQLEPSEVFDVHRALPRFSGDLSAVVRAASLYLQHSPHLVSSMYSSVLEGDAGALRKSARVLRIAADALCASRVREIAYTIEQACQYSDPRLLRPAVDECLTEDACLRVELKRLARTSRY